MTTTPTKKLKESNFGLIHYSSALSHYMDQDFNIAMEVFAILDNKYFCQDWGIVESDSIQFNNETVKNENGGDILAVYKLSTGRKIWIKTVGYGIKENQMDLKEYTKADYNNTCIMFPEDY
jgi:hypothetical protein